MADLLAGIAVGALGAALLAGIAVAAWRDRRRQPEATMWLEDR